MKDLNAQQHKFVGGLALGLSGRDAAIAAGYAANSAAVTASKLLAKPEVKEALSAYFKREAEQVAMDRERLRQRLMSLAMAEAHEVFNNDWTLKPKNTIPPDVLRLIVSARSWDTPDQGKGASAKLLNPTEPIRTYLKLFPEVAAQEENLQEAAEMVESTLEELIQRLESSTGSLDDESSIGE